MLDKWKEGQGSGQGPKGKDPNKLFAHVWIIEEQYTNFSLKTERPYVMREKSHSPDCIYTAWPVSTKRDETGRSIFIPNGTIDKENWSPPSYIKMRVTYALHEEVIDKCEHKRDLPEDLKQEIDRKLHEWRNQALGRGYRKGPGKK
jgi:hypothetical protein